MHPTNMHLPCCNRSYIATCNHNKIIIYELTIIIGWLETVNLITEGLLLSPRLLQKYPQVTCLLTSLSAWHLQIKDKLACCIAISPTISGSIVSSLFSYITLRWINLYRGIYLHNHADHFFTGTQLSTRNYNYKCPLCVCIYLQHQTCSIIASQLQLSF